MADIALRKYLEDIDQLIDGKQVDEAIAHCRHILSYYPKHIDTYRLFGKALLEKGRHGDAADIFQRVLSAVPDDFVSHVGMSIVREDEANLEAALWHMERAFESNPANNAIQEELRRLYGRRDGVMPPKTRLTRGALARMYARGELYPQAEAEIRAALTSDPDRVDLETILAQVYWSSERRAEAAETCSSIIQKLPYNQEANRILAHLFQTQGRADDAIPYRQRLEALDPYEAHADPARNGRGAALANPESVRLPRLDYAPGMEQAGAGPDWVTSIGMQFEQPAGQPAEAAPDWLREAAPPEVQPESPFAADLPAAEMPDWLQEIQKSTGMLGTPAPEAAPGGPDWLSELGASPASPDTSADWITAETVAAEEPPAMSTPDWLKAATGPLTPDALPEWMKTGPLKEPEPIAPPSAGEVPDWMKSLAPTEEAPAGEDSLDWMKAAAPPPAIVSGPEALSEDQPIDWAQSIEAVPGEMPDWMKEVAPPPPPAAEDETPDWLKGLEPQTPAESQTPAVKPIKRLTDRLDPNRVKTGQLGSGPLKEPSPAPEAETPDWMKSVFGEAEGGATAAEELPDWMKAAPPADEVPDWMRATALSPDETAEPSEPVAQTPLWMQAAGPESALPAEEAPEWMKPAFGEAEGTAAPEVAAPDEMPDWMRGAAQESAAPAAEMPDWMKPAFGEVEEAAAPEMAAPAEIPDWMRGAAQESAAPAEEMPDWMKPAFGEAEETAAPEMAAAAEIPDWMQVAAQESVAPAEEMPDWMKSALGEVEEAPAPAVQETPPLPAPEKKKAAAADLPEFLQPASEEAIARASEPTHLADDFGDESKENWLKEVVGVQAGPVAPEDEPMAAGEVPDWIKAMMPSEPAPASAEASSQSAASLTDFEAALEAARRKGQPQAVEWLGLEPAEEGSGAQPAAEAPGEAVPDWMQPVLSEAEGAASAEQMPDWMQAAEPEAAPPAEETAAPEITAPAEMPDWMQPALGEAEGAAEAAPDWMKAALGETEASEAQAETMPAWMESAPEVEGLVEAAPTPPAEEIDWMSPDAMLKMMAQMGVETPATPPPAEAPVAAEPTPSEAVETPGPVAEKPDWLKQVEAEAEAYEAAIAPQPAPAEEIPDWTRGAAAETPAPAEEAGEPPAPAAAFPDWLRAPAAEEEAEALDWAESAEPQGKPVPEWLRQPGEGAVMPPIEWLRAPVESAAAEAAEAPSAPEEDLPPWMKKPRTPLPEEAMPPAVAEAPEPAASAPTETPAPAEEEIDWMSPDAMLKMMAQMGVETPATPPPAEAPVAAEPTPSEAVETPGPEAEKPDWLKQMEAEADAYEAIAAAQPTQPESAPAPAEEEIDWMSPDAMLKMMAQMGIDTQAPLSTTTPETEAAVEMPVASIESGPPTAEMSPEEALRWLEGLALQQGSGPEEAPAEGAVAPPAWVTAPQEEEVPPAEPGVIPDWLKAIAPQAEAQAQEPAPSPAPEPVQAEMSPDEALQWLENLARQQGASPEEIVAQPAEGVVVTPEWIKAQQAPSPTAMQPETEAPAPPPVVEPPPAVEEARPSEAAPAAAPEPEAETPEAGPDKLARLAERLATSRRTKESEIAARFESQRLAREAAQREIQEKMEKRRSDTGRIGRGTGPLKGTGPLQETGPLKGTGPLQETEAVEADKFETAKLAETAPLTPVAPEPAAELSQLAAQVEPPEVVKKPAAPKPRRTPRPKASRPRRAGKSSSPYAAEAPENVITFSQARLGEGEHDQAAEALGYLILTNQMVEEVITVLETYAAGNTPSLPVLQTLGDAYLKVGRLQKALDAYQRALGQV